MSSPCNHHSPPSRGLLRLHHHSPIMEDAGKRTCMTAGRQPIPFPWRPTMSNVFTSAGTTLEVVADTPATYDEAGYSALTYTAVGEITDMGEYGPEYEVVTHNPLGERRTVKRKGTANDGAITMQLGRDPSDAGQTILYDGVDGAERDTVHSFKVTLQDGTVQYFTGQIYSFTTNVGSVNQITGASVTVEIDREIVEVAA